MKKICHWILYGTGRGKRYLFLVSLLFSVITCSIVYISWNKVLDFPTAQKIIADIPELKMENGVLTEPKDSYYQISWDVNDAQSPQLKKYNFIIDTKSDEIDANQISENGIYLTNRNIYILSDNSLTKQSLEKFPDFEIKKGTLLLILKEGTLRFCMILCITLTLILFLNLYIWSLIYALFSYLLTLFISVDDLSFAQRRRLSVVALIFAYILILPFSLGSLYNLVFILFGLVLAVMGLFLSYLPKNLIISIDK